MSLWVLSVAMETFGNKGLREVDAVEFNGLVSGGICPANSSSCYHRCLSALTASPRCVVVDGNTLNQTACSSRVQFWLQVPFKIRIQLKVEQLEQDCKSVSPEVRDISGIGHRTTRHSSPRRR